MSVHAWQFNQDGKIERPLVTPGPTAVRVGMRAMSRSHPAALIPTGIPATPSRRAP